MDLMVAVRAATARRDPERHLSLYWPQFACAIETRDRVVWAPVRVCDRDTRQRRASGDNKTISTPDGGGSRRNVTCP
ncbi:unnamed protein product [Euphydryas editha]|uniref:Uncharacterized protein n=1 Tax=Euphydryas editha TaxID=104508 RepID=A0AAU9TG73_EUPED|nr:unnamed protein product [Euphydryas editha]